MRRWLERFEAYRPFTPAEAWWLFVAAAIGEATGWTFLLYGIAAEYLGWPGKGFALPIGGSLHGLFYLAYVFMVIAGYSSLGWSRRAAIIGLISSVPPYGTIVFEQWAARRRKGVTVPGWRVSVRGILIHNNKVLAIQAADKTNWEIPGPLLERSVPPERSLQQWWEQVFDLKVTVQKLVLTSEIKQTRSPELGLYYEVVTAKALDPILILRTLREDQLVEEAEWLNLNELDRLGDQDVIGILRSMLKA